MSNHYGIGILFKNDCIKLSVLSKREAVTKIECSLEITVVYQKKLTEASKLIREKLIQYSPFTVHAGLGNELFTLRFYPVHSALPQKKLTLLKHELNSSPLEFNHHLELNDSNKTTIATISIKNKFFHSILYLIKTCKLKQCPILIELPSAHNRASDHAQGFECSTSLAKMSLAC